MSSLLITEIANDILDLIPNYRFMINLPHRRRLRRKVSQIIRKLHKLQLKI